MFTSSSFCLFMLLSPAMIFLHSTHAASNEASASTCVGCIPGKSVSTRNAGPKLRILIIVPANKVTDTHFKLHLNFAKILAQDKSNVEMVYLLGLVEKPEDEKDENMENGRLVVLKRNRCGNPPAHGCPIDFEGMVMDVWTSRPDFFPRGERDDFHLNFQLNNGKLLNDLREKNFNVGVIEMIEQWNLSRSVLELFPTIKKTVGTSSVPPTILHWKYLGYTDVVQNIPGLNLAVVDSHKGVRINDRGISRTNEHFIKAVETIGKNTHADFLKAIAARRTVFARNFELPNMGELFQKLSLFFTNTQPLLDYQLVERSVRKREKSRVSGPKLRFFGGIALPNMASAQLNPDTKEIFDKAGQIVFISFGSVVDMGTPGMTQIALGKEEVFKDVFKHIEFANVHFIWKYGQNKQNYSQPPGTNSRVHAKAWLEQPAILYKGGAGPYAKLIAFISHCGLNSVNEAVAAGVPLICVPFFGDQYNNAEALASRDVAIVVDVHLAASEFKIKLLGALNEMRTNKKYKVNMQALQKQFKKIDPKKEVLREFKKLREELANEGSNAKKGNKKGSKKGSKKGGQN